MLFPLSLTALCLLLDVAEQATVSEHERELENTFRSRTPADWGRVWHKETHNRCREQLFRHLYWACEKDIYRLARRDVPSYPFVGEENARGLIRVRRRRAASSITNECCLSSAGCTWEEYAEYCPSQKRVRKVAYFRHHT